MAIKKANHWIDEGHVYPVPNHLKSAHAKQQKDLGHNLKRLLALHPCPYPNDSIKQVQT